MTARQSGLDGVIMAEGKCSNPKCGRRLTDPKSILRSYGPVCWGRLQAQREKDHQENKLPCTIIDPTKAAVSIMEIRDWALSNLKVDRCFCGNLFKDCDLESYDYGDSPAGYALEGFKYRVWLYFHCDKCGNDETLWKCVK